MEIKKVSYKYNNNLLNPITYYLETDKTTTSIDFKSALEIAYAVIDSLYGSYEYLDDLVDEFEEEKNKGIKIEEV